jgi:circadian clock protein KaiB
MMSDAPRYELTLYINGASQLSARAIASSRQLCERHLSGDYCLAVIDVREDATQLGDRVLATPTLVRNRPLPVRELVGDLSQTGKVLRALGLPVSDDDPQARD